VLIKKAAPRGGFFKLQILKILCLFLNYFAGAAAGSAAASFAAFSSSSSDT
jgi:hypothetical protein